MDLSELIKCYNMEHKSLFTAFAVSFPVLFTVLYLYIPEFANLEFYEQVVFSATASIFCVYISYLFTVIVYRAGRERYRRRHLPLLICTLAASFWLIVFPNNYGLGYRYVIYVFPMCTSISMESLHSALRLSVSLGFFPIEPKISRNE